MIKKTIYDTNKLRLVKRNNGITLEFFVISAVIGIVSGAIFAGSVFGNIFLVR